jgi:hypothetical protein
MCGGVVENEKIKGQDVAVLCPRRPSSKKRRENGLRERANGPPFFSNSQQIFTTATQIKR